MVSGCDLFTFLQKQPGTRLSENSLKGIVVQLLSAVDGMHKAGVLHRDLKLDNLMLTSTGILKIIDFNLGVALEHGTMGKFALSDAVGTPQYASPLILACSLQQQQNKLLARRGVVTNPSTYLAHPCIDMWSVGVCIQGLATGRFPFHATHAQPLFQEIREYALGLRKIHFPCDISPMVQHFVQTLLTASKATTAQDAMSHPWLASEFQRGVSLSSPALSVSSTVVSSAENVAGAHTRQWTDSTEATVLSNSSDAGAVVKIPDQVYTTRSRATLA